MLSLADADTGRAARARHGAPPRDLDRCVAWVERHFPLIVRWCDDLLSGADGAYRAVGPAERGDSDLAGVILLRPGVPHARWVLAHELSHALTGGSAGYFLWSDGRYHSNLAAERAANACAAGLLLDVYAIRDRLAEDWTVSEIARAEGVTPEAVRLRLHLGVLLGESRPTRVDALLRTMATGAPEPGDGWDGC